MTWLQIVGPANPLLKTCASFNNRHRRDRAPTSCHPVGGCFETTDGNRFEPTDYVKIKPVAERKGVSLGNNGICMSGRAKLETVGSRRVA